MRDFCSLTWWAFVGLLRSSARSGEPGAAPADKRPAADRAKKASHQQHGPIDIGRPLSAVPRCAGRADDHQAGYRAQLAPGRVQSLLAVEIENPRGTAKVAERATINELFLRVCYSQRLVCGAIRATCE